MRMIVLIILSVMRVLYLTNAYDFSCPPQSQWSLRAKSKCMHQRNYSCLFDVNYQVNVYRDKCIRPRILGPGYTYVFQPNPNRASCSLSRYQPFIFKTTGYSDCVFLKSLCNSEGQTTYDDKSTRSDRICSCNTETGYHFVRKPEHGCRCNPLSEDCSCYIGIHNQTIGIGDLNCFDEMNIRPSPSPGYRYNISQSLKNVFLDNYKYNINPPIKENRTKAVLFVLILVASYPPSAVEKNSKASTEECQEIPGAVERNSTESTEELEENPGAVEKNSKASTEECQEIPGAVEKNSKASTEECQEIPGAVERNSTESTEELEENPGAVERNSRALTEEFDEPPDSAEGSGSSFLDFDEDPDILIGGSSSMMEDSGEITGHVTPKEYVFPRTKNLPASVYLRHVTPKEYVFPKTKNLPVSVTLRKKLGFELEMGEDLSFYSFIKIGKTLVFTDKLNKRLITCNVDGTDMHYIHLTHRPHYIVKIDSKTVAVSCGEEKIILIIDIFKHDKGSKLYEIKTSCECYAISFDEMQLFVFNKRSNTIDVLGVAGTVRQDPINLPSDCIVDISVDRDRLVCIDKTSIYCCSLDGKLTWKSKPNTYHDLHQVTTDKEKNVYVTDYYNSTVVVVSHDGNNRRNILTKSDGLIWPNAIYFDKQAINFLVLNYRDGKVSFFLCEKEPDIQMEIKRK